MFLIPSGLKWTSSKAGSDLWHLAQIKHSVDFAKKTLTSHRWEFKHYDLTPNEINIDSEMMAGSDTLGLVQCTLDTQINRPKPKKSEPLPSTSSSLGLSQRSSTENDPIALSSAATSPSQSVLLKDQCHLQLLFLLGNRLTRRQSAMMIR